jgi:cob(I)alamin adenosyltransferase
MLSAATATSNGSSNQAQIASLDKQLAKYEKELSSDETSKNTTAAQLVATQITLVESEIAQLSRVVVPSVLSAASGASTDSSSGEAGRGTTSVLGNAVNTSA